MPADQQPWLANPQWTQKRISGTPAASVLETTARGTWLTGAMALAVGAVELVLKGADTWNERSPFFLALLVFPFLGVTILYLKLRAAYRKRRYAGTYFEMDSLPFFLGRTLSGRIHAPSGANPHGPVQLTLNCVRRTKTWVGRLAGGHYEIWDDLIWRQEKTYVPGPVADVDTGAGSITIPVEFTLPNDAPSTDSANPDDRIIWTLKASAKARRAGFVQYFELPVFTESGVSRRPQPYDRDFCAPVAVSLGSTQPSPNRQVVVTASSAGGTEFLFLASRHWGTARFATGAFCVWTAAIRFLFWGTEPLALSLFVAADFLLFFWATWCWLSKSSAVFEHGNVVVRSSLLGIGKSLSIPYGDVRDITAPIARTSGQGTEAIPYYTVFLKTSQGDIEVGGSLRDAGEAGYVVKRMKAELGLIRS